MQHYDVAGEGAHIKEFGMWSYTEAETMCLAAPRPPVREDAPDVAA